MTHRTTPVRGRRSRALLAGGAAGALALAAVAALPGTTASAAPSAFSAASPGAASAPATVARSVVRITVSDIAGLRSAVAMANRSSDPVVVTLGDDITLDAGLGGGAQSGDLDLTGTLIVLGNGYTIDADGVDRIFDVAVGGSLRLDRTKLTGGAPAATESGGAIASAGLVVLIDSVVKNSTVAGDGASGGALFNDGGVLRVRNTRLVDNAASRAGGAIEANSGRTLVSGSRFARNDAGTGPGNGGGLHLTGDGYVRVTESSFVRNTAVEGGGLWNSATGQMQLNDVMFQANSASGDDADQGGGAIYTDGLVAVRSSRLMQNSATGTSGSGGGALNVGGTLRLIDTVVRGNDAQRAGGGVEASGGATTLVDATLRFNTAGANPGNGGGLHLTGAGNVVLMGGVVDGNIASAEGGGLWNSSGGTMEVRGTEIADNKALGADATNGGGGIFNAGGELIVTDASITGNLANGASGSGGGIFVDGGSLDADGTTLDGNGAVRAGGAIEATTGTLDLDMVTMNANLAGGPSAAPGNGGAIHISGAATTTVTDSTVTDNSAAREGGGLWNAGAGATMYVVDTTLTGNVAEGPAADDGGGALFNNGGTMEVTTSTITGNSATGASGSGGGILNLGGDLTVTDSTVDGNDAVRAGGGIESAAGTVDVVGGTLSDNVLGANPGNGGGLHIGGAGTSTVTDTVVDGNSAVEGGGLWNSVAGTMTVTGATVTGNTASGVASDQGGGGIYNDGGSLTVEAGTTDTTIDDNAASGTAGSGGGLFNNGGAVDVSGTSFSGNTAVRAGGGIEMLDLGAMTPASLNLSDVDFSANTAGPTPGNGGGVHVTGAGVTTYTGGVVELNTATNEGGGLWCSNAGQFTATGITFGTGGTANDAPAGPDVFFQSGASMAGVCSVNGTVLTPGTGLPAAP
ncbi:MAG: hypothetical protein CMH83_18490 [Nocardioides sp.]|nr:hypothetical protein [Nocardioides sp.]